MPYVRTDSLVRFLVEFYCDVFSLVCRHFGEDSRCPNNDGGYSYGIIFHFHWGNRKGEIRKLKCGNVGRIYTPKLGRRHRFQVHAIPISLDSRRYNPKLRANRR